MSLTNVKIVADSSSDVLSMTDIPFASAPLKIITSEKEYTDNTDLDVAQMVEDLQNYKGRSSTSCPSPSDWVDSFGDAQYIFCVSITSALSGCYNSAVIAKNEYESNYPQRRVFVIDSLSTGPEMQLIIEKLREYIKKGYDFDEISEITEGLSGADLKAVCTEAGMFAIRSDRKEVISKDFLDAIDKIMENLNIS